MRGGTVARAAHSSSRRGHSVGIHVPFSRIRFSRRERLLKGRPHGAGVKSDHGRRMLMNGTKVLGLAAVGALFVIAAPVERAQAVSLINPGVATVVQQDTKELTEVRWGWHHHHHWRRWHHRRGHWHHHRRW
jgi:hypothetical protein